MSGVTEYATSLTTAATVNEGVRQKPDCLPLKSEAACTLCLPVTATVGLRLPLIAPLPSEGPRGEVLTRTL